MWKGSRKERCAVLRKQEWANVVIHVFLVALLVVCCVPSPSWAQDKYGAIAYSASDRSYGYSYDYDTREEAEQKALQECEARGKGCKVLTWFKNNCGALATASNGSYGYAWDDTREAAIEKALGLCRQYGGKDCRWRCWSCNSR